MLSWSFLNCRLVISVCSSTCFLSFSLKSPSFSLLLPFFLFPSPSSGQRVNTVWLTPCHNIITSYIRQQSLNQSRWRSDHPPSQSWNATSLEWIKVAKAQSLRFDFRVRVFSELNTSSFVPINYANQSLLTPL